MLGNKNESKLLVDKIKGKIIFYFNSTFTEKYK